MGEGMDARVGPPSPLNVRFSAEKCPRGIDQGSLDASGVFLHLPPAVAGPVVFDSQFVSQRRRGTNRLSATGRKGLPDHGLIS